jgi:hypothetical protein
MSSDPDLTSASLHSIAFSDDINLDSCNDAELGRILEAINRIGSNLNSSPAIIPLACILGCIF